MSHDAHRGDRGRWDPPALDELSAILGNFPGPWWVAGGWAIDLCIGSQTRTHDDLDVEILRVDAPLLLEVLSGWEHHAAAGGTLERWSGETDVAAAANGLWSRPRGADAWAVQFMLAGGDRRDWRYRRDERIRRPIQEVGLRTATGLPHLAPKTELLYKSVKLADKDHADFGAVLGTMTASQREWLATALATVGSEHPWIPRLGES